MSTNTITEVIEGIKKHGPEILEHCVIDNADQYLEKINKEFLAKNIEKKSFTIKTYDAFEAKILLEHYSLQKKNNKNYTFEVLNTRGEKETRIYNKNAVLVYFENELFQGSLLKKGKYK